MWIVATNEMNSRDDFSHRDCKTLIFASTNNQDNYTESDETIQTTAVDEVLCGVCSPSPLAGVEEHASIYPPIPEDIRCEKAQLNQQAKHKNEV